MGDQKVEGSWSGEGAPARAISRVMLGIEGPREVPLAVYASLQKEGQLLKGFAFAFVGRLKLD